MTAAACFAARRSPTFVTAGSLPNPKDDGAVKQAVLNHFPPLNRSTAEPGRFLSQPATTFGRIVPAPRVEPRMFVPALFTSESMRPHCSRVAATSLSGTPGAAMSPWTYSASGKEAATASPSATVLDELTSTAATAEAKARAEIKAAELATKLGITFSAVAEFFKILGEQDVPEDKIQFRLIEVATHFGQTRDELAALVPDDPNAAELARAGAQVVEPRAKRCADLIGIGVRHQALELRVTSGMVPLVVRDDVLEQRIGRPGGG